MTWRRLLLTFSVVALLFISDAGARQTFQRGSGSGSGDVVGPASSTDNGVARYDGTTGELLQDTSAATIDDDGDATVRDIDARNVTAESVAISGAGTAGIVLEDETDCEDPPSGSTTICTKNGKPQYRDTGGSTTPIFPTFAECSRWGDDFVGFVQISATHLEADGTWAQSKVNNSDAPAMAGLSATAASTGHIRLDTSTATNGAYSIYKSGQVAGTPRAILTGFDHYAFRVAPVSAPTTDDYQIIIGLCDDIDPIDSGGTYECDDGIGFFLNTAVSDNWIAFSTDDGWATRSTTDTGVAAAAGTFQVFEIKCTTSTCTSVDFIIDGTVEATHTTASEDDIPRSSADATYAPLIGIAKVASAVSATDRQMYVDYIGYERCPR